MSDETIKYVLAPLTIKEIKKKYPDKATSLLKDPIHIWRAETGIELIHKEPHIKEQMRIWKNWQQMSDEQRTVSDQKSLKLFGVVNQEHHLILIKQHIKQ